MGNLMSNCCTQNNLTIISLIMVLMVKSANSQIYKKFIKLTFTVTYQVRIYIKLMHIITA